LGGAIELPAALDDSVAKARVCELLIQNGASSTDCPGGTDSNVHVLTNQQDGSIKSQMDVEVSQTIKTFFGRFLGIDTLSVRRKAQAQYDPPVAMGSPANNLGDVPVCPSGSPGCLSVPKNGAQKLWVSVQGGGGFKQHGNALTTHNCSTGVDGCTGGINDENNGDGEYLSVQDDQPGAHAAGPANRTYEGFHRWYTLCSIAGVPRTPGHEYRVHVTSGGGLFTNQFSLLALHGPVPGNQRTIFTRERLPLVAVDTAVDHANPPEFYSPRVLPSSKDRMLEVDFFDLGDTSLAPTSRDSLISWPKA
jgi:hypothetical protein